MEGKALTAPEVATELGSIRIADEVVAIIAGLAATEVEGVAGMSGGIAGGIAEMLGRKNLSKGVKVEVGEKEAAVDIFVIVEYGVRIPEVAVEIQDKVKRAIESMTGLKVVEVNVHVQGVAFQQEKAAEEEPARVR
ncbi:Asp23/Gls24 family envelope stress response protein [Thermanaeromonas sp. C210]|uniref:Asp23/Gls24 family envelope stress response protein n=1 Tax=Thermanaeromonas sp. C210 TaxID=2731925 RepID=UPI00155D0BAE|nr:Asp23/Gls24 family envelope stress response protein [Thermanaeromonas sp. C210]MBE3572307.1 Asp23/Gls24 family envelope stress response protein [Moorella humiferrea]GFN23317.1 alkaline-shock protein [Thermanaeromonas sp. C210]